VTQQVVDNRQDGVGDRDHGALHTPPGPQAPILGRRVGVVGVCRASLARSSRSGVCWYFRSCPGPGRPRQDVSVPEAQEYIRNVSVVKVVCLIPQGNRISRGCSYRCIMYARVRLPTRFTITTECD
jgi:hypothetical protein